jgi:hypothetical protein
MTVSLDCGCPSVTEPDIVYKFMFFVKHFKSECVVTIKFNLIHFKTWKIN